MSSEFTAAGVNWIAFDEPAEPVRAEVRVRYRHTPAPATITPLRTTACAYSFDEPQRAITPGQATVFYRGDEVVGGGWIVKSSEQVSSRQDMQQICSIIDPALPALCSLPPAPVLLNLFPCPHVLTTYENP